MVIPDGCKVPPMISRLPALVILLSALLTLLACAQDANANANYGDGVCGNAHVNPYGNGNASPNCGA